MKIKTTLLLGVCLAAFTLTASAQSWLTNGLVAHYPFNGNANDESGNGNNATSVGPVLAPDRFGKPASAYAFTASGQYIYSSSQTVVPLGTNDFSISVWMSLSSYASEAQVLFNNRRLDALQISLNPFSNTRAALDFHTGPQTQPADAKTSALHWDLGRWYNVQVIRKGYEVSIYRDGGLEGQSLTTDGNWATPAENEMVLGYQISWSRHTLRGSLDDVRVYNRALSAGEVAELYTIESGPRVDLIKAVKPSFRNLTLATDYQLQVSGDMNIWTNHGTPFTATNTSMVYPQYWDVDNWGSLFFRLQEVP